MADQRQRGTDWQTSKDMNTSNFPHFCGGSQNRHSLQARKKGRIIFKKFTQLTPAPYQGIFPRSIHLEDLIRIPWEPARLWLQPVES